MKKCLLGIFSFLFFQCAVLAQVNEPDNNEVYNFLYRMSEKGLIKFDDYILPLDRHDIKKALLTLKLSDSILSKIEKSELYFYLRDFGYDSPSIQTQSSGQFVKFIRSDDVGRFRVFAASDSTANIFLEPAVGLSITTYNNSHTTTYYNGARLWGNISKNIGFNLSYHDITENGDSLDVNKTFTPSQGIINTSHSAHSLNYSNLFFNIGYRWKNGAITIAKNNINWGYGVGGKIVLSSKAPAFPYISFDFQPFKWLKFNYFHGWLNSDIIDSSASYTTGTGIAGNVRTIYRSKFIASHTITITPTKGFDASFGESMIYSDKLDIGYLVPINFFKLYDQYSGSYNISGGGNSQFFFQLSSRNQIKNTHVYFVSFIDELYLAKIFNAKEKRNQFGYTIGINNTDLLLPYLSIGVEYTRINPFVYSNLIPAQTYTNQSYIMGDWMGNNADRLYLYACYTPMPRLKLNIWGSKIRKGAAGTLDQQYNQQPEPGFLFEKLFDRVDLSFLAKYELINSLKFNLGFQITSYQYPSYKTNNQAVTFGISYGF